LDDSEWLAQNRICTANRILDEAFFEAASHADGKVFGGTGFSLSGFDFPMSEKRTG